MTIHTLYTEAIADESVFFNMTGMAKNRFNLLVPHFQMTLGKSLSMGQKLFLILYANKKPLTEAAVGKYIYQSKFSMRGKNFLDQGRIALREAQAQVTQEDTHSPYLGLPPAVGNKKCILTHAPLNSSGDIYHVLAYLILAAHYRKELPQVILTYDVKTTEKQANRSLGFANALNHSRFFKTEQIAVKNKTYYENVRQSQLEEHLRDNYPEKIYMDQMATTTTIAKLFLQHGFETITAILRRGFSTYDTAHYPVKTQRKVNQYVDAEMNQLNNEQQNKPIIVLHLRHASSANERLNIPDNIVVKLIQYLSEKGYDAWCVMADDRKNPPAYASRYKTSPFSEPITHNGVDYSKFQHLNLMMRIAQTQQIKGVIGNTSGTLDGAAFVGNRVYNIHQFNAKLSYQDLRLTMQLSFFSVEDLKPVNGKRANALIKDVLPNFKKWLVNNQMVQPTIQYTNLNINMTQAGTRKLYNIFAPEKSYLLPDVSELNQNILDALSSPR